MDARALTTETLARGWVGFPLLTPDECASVLAECARLFADSATRHPRDKPASGTRHLEALDERSSVIADLIARPALVDAVQAWFGSEPAPSTAEQVSLRAPGPGFGEQDLHRDAIEGPPLEVPQVVTAIVALVDFTATNGATRIVPGSHRTNQTAAVFRGRHHAKDEVRLTGAAGTAFVFTGHALHAGGRNDSDQPRPALQLVWRR